MQGFSSRQLRRLAAKERSEVLNQRSYIDSDENDSTSQNSFDSQESNPLETKAMNESDNETDGEDITSLQIKLRDWYLTYKPPKNCVENLLKLLKSENIDVPITIKGLLEIGNERAVKQLLVKREEINEFDTMSQIFLELRKLNAKTDRNENANKKLITKLTEELIMLRNEVRQFKSLQSTEADISLVPPLPFCTLSSLTEFDGKLLSDENTRLQLKRAIQRIGANEVPAFLRMAIKKVISDDLAVNLTWRGTNDKPSIQQFNVFTIIKESNCGNIELKEQPIIALLLAEVRSLRQELVDRDEPYKKMMGRLTEEVVILRNEIRHLKKTTTLFGDNTTNLLPNLPLNSVEELNKFDNELNQNAEIISQLQCELIKLGGDDLPRFIRSAARKIMTDELAMQFSWTGTVAKPSIQNFYLVSVIRDICHQKFNTAKDFKIHSVLQQHFVHAKDRLTKRMKKNTESFD